MLNFNPYYLNYETVEMDDLLRSPHLLVIARDLTLGRPSGMNSALDHYSNLMHERSINATAIFAMYSRQAVGWTLLTHETDAWEFSPQADRACTHVYVHGNFRRHGIGRQLLKIAATLVHPDQIIQVYGWSNPRFFESVMKEHNSFQSL